MEERSHFSQFIDIASFFRGFTEAMTQKQTRSTRKFPHNTRGARIRTSGKAKRYQRSRVGPPRRASARGPLSLAKLDAVVALRLRGEYGAAMDLILDVLKYTPKCPRAKKEFQRLNNIIMSLPERDEEGNLVQ